MSPDLQQSPLKPVWRAIQPQPIPRPREAPEGSMWVCNHCGRESKTWKDWDLDCALEAMLCKPDNV